MGVRLALLALSGLLLGLCSIILILGIFLIIIISIFAQIIIVVIVEILAFNLVLQFFELKSFTGVPVNGARDKLLFDVFTKVIVELQSLLKFSVGIVVVIVTRERFGGVEEIEETFGRDSPLNNTGLLGIY